MGLGKAVPLRINKTWIEKQSRLAMDNPADKARRSGKPTLIEFGATGCVPCDMMQPILDSLRRNHPEKLNVVFVHVGEEQILAARYSIQSIPVQVFFDAQGIEVFRHVGFFAQSEVERQLEKMGAAK
jgi:thiol-disulfide isomerase/thioredoxin